MNERYSLRTFRELQRKVTRITLRCDRRFPKHVRILCQILTRAIRCNDGRSARQTLTVPMFECVVIESLFIRMSEVSHSIFRNTTY